MSKKSICIWISIVLILIISSFVFMNNNFKNIYSHIAIGCFIEDYYQKKDIAYVTIKMDNSKNIIKEFKVEDKKLQEQLSKINLPDVIGVNMLMTIPEKEIKNTNIDFQKINIFNLLYSSNTYDKYIVVTGISLKS